MKKEIKFRGRRLDNEEWVYGFFTKKKIGHLIAPVIEVYKEWDSGDYIETYEVNGDTVGEFTGLPDKNGKEIYEGDIISIYEPYTKSQLITAIIWDDPNCRFAMMYTYMDFDFLTSDECEVIGNIYENPELLKP